MAQHITLLAVFLKQGSLDLFFVSLFPFVPGLAVFALGLTVDVFGFRKLAHQHPWNFNLWQQSCCYIAFTLLAKRTAQNIMEPEESELEFHSRWWMHWLGERLNINTPKGAGWTWKRSSGRAKRAGYQKMIHLPLGFLWTYRFCRWRHWSNNFHLNIYLCLLSAATSRFVWGIVCVNSWLNIFTRPLITQDSLS